MAIVKSQISELLDLKSLKLIDNVYLVEHMKPLQERAKELKRKSPNFVGDPAFLISIEMMIDEIDGQRPNPLNLTDFVRNLPMMDTNYIVQYCQKINESVGLDTLLNYTCDVCGLDYQSRFRTNGGFFGPSLNL